MSVCGENICRLCASTTENSVKIFKNGTSELTVVGDMMADCILSEIKANTGYPDIVCHLCNLQLNVFYEFKKKALEHHAQFTTRINASNENRMKNERQPIDENGKVNKLGQIVRVQNVHHKSDAEETADDASIYENITTYLKQERLEEEELDIDGHGTTTDGEDYEERLTTGDNQIGSDGMEPDGQDEHDQEEERLDTDSIADGQLLEEIELPLIDENTPVDYADESNLRVEMLESDQEKFLADIKCEKPEYLDDDEDEDDDNDNVDDHQDGVNDADYLDAEYSDVLYLDEENNQKIQSHDDQQQQQEKELSDANVDEENENKMEIEMLEQFLDDDGGGDNINNGGGSGHDGETANICIPKKRPRDKSTTLRYPCSHCSKVFDKLADVRKHSQIHKISKTCHICDIQTYDIEKHLKKHGLNTQTIYRCSICDKEFTSALQCEVHEYRHTNVRPFPCTLCDKSFKLRCDLHIHMMCHNDVRKHVCKICGRGFRMASHLKGHIETHNTENKIECEICGKLFKTSGSLKSHRLQIHTETMLHTCDICEKGFCRRDKMERHRKTHERKMTKLLSIANVQNYEIKVFGTH